MNGWADVLIVEDEKKLRHFTGEILKFEGITSAAAEDGCKAIAYLENVLARDGEMPRVILLDVNMPCKGGLEVYSELSQKDWIKNTVIIITSAIGEEIDMLSGPAQTEMLHKPYDVKALVALIRHVAPDLFSQV